MSTGPIILSVALLGLSLAPMGCGSIGEPRRSVPAVPAAHPALAAPTDARVSTPPLVWVPAWQMYLRDGDVVYYSGWYYSYRSGQWYVSRSDNGPWTAVVTGEARPVDQRQPEARARKPATSARASSHQRQHDGASGRESARASVETASRIVSVALQHIGAPYRWGGADPRGFDCSGFVMFVYGKAGTSLPHGAVQQYKFGVPVSRAGLEPGDIVFFDRLRHNGIYIGDGQFIHSSKSGDVVKVSRLDEDWFERRWVGARRLAIADGGEIRQD